MTLPNDPLANLWEKLGLTESKPTTPAVEHVPIIEPTVEPPPAAPPLISAEPFLEPVTSPMDTDSYPPGAVYDAEHLEPLFDQAFGHKPNSSFLNGLYETYQRKNFISERQYNVLLDMAEGA